MMKETGPTPSESQQQKIDKLVDSGVFSVDDAWRMVIGSPAPNLLDAADMQERSRLILDSLSGINASNKGFRALNPDGSKRHSKIPGNPSEIKKTAQENLRISRKQFEKACGYCALQQLCPMANFYSDFHVKYKQANNRDKFAKALDEDPSTPC
ncbi:hypothetical protein KA043_04000 [Candidatus Saccharibacteria bacterium]|nr:hypothetical protein [Candidatus Saccharibacteria bacterium]